MKFFVFTLALAVLTGTSASVLRDEPDSKLEKLTQQAAEDAEIFIQTLFGKLFILESTEEAKGPGLVEFLNRVQRNISRRLNNLEEELPAEAVEAFEVFWRVPTQLVEKAMNALYELRRHERENLEELRKALLSALAGYVDPALEKVGPYAATVRSAVIARAQEIDQKINENLPQQVQTLRAQLDPHVKKLQDLQVALQPYFDHTQELFRKGVETVHKHLLKPYIGPIVEFHKKHKNEFREWVRAPVFSPKP